MSRRARGRPALAVPSAGLTLAFESHARCRTPIELARATLARIRENLAFAVLYNAIAIPLAASGLLQPLYAAVAMGASSLVVTANAIRLGRWTPRT